MRGLAELLHLSALGNRRAKRFLLLIAAVYVTVLVGPVLIAAALASKGS